jgi:hypothetical protein
MAENFTVDAPDFDLIRKESGPGTEAGMRSLWYVLNDERASRRRGDNDDWIRSPFFAADYTGNGAMTVTVSSSDVIDFAHKLHGRTLLVSFVVRDISIGGVPNTAVQISNRAWGGYTVASNAGATVLYSNPCMIRDNTGVAIEIGTVAIQTGQTVISITRCPVANWTASANNSAFYGQLAFEVNI